VLTWRNGKQPVSSQGAVCRMCRVALVAVRACNAAQAVFQRLPTKAGTISGGGWPVRVISGTRVML
jgi:hypothetical protein